MTDELKRKITDICEDYNPRKPGMGKRIQEVVDAETASLRRELAEVKAERDRLKSWHQNSEMAINAAAVRAAGGT